ncbi:MAG TPA: nucleotidyl transferase AbiEii/AbiGii toxin family protein [Ignavibacteria bacterium]
MTDLNHHKQIITRILGDIFKDNELSQSIGFKGGTAANIFYELPRFSVDLDFDLLKPGMSETIIEKITPILTKYGQLKDVFEKRFSILFEISYSAKSQNIKVEINKRDFGSGFEIKYFYGIPIKVMLREDMFANKLVAMYERECKTNRDIFDVWYFLDKNWNFNKDIIKKRTKMDYAILFKKLIKQLKNKSGSRILSGLGDFLGEDMKKWVKASLVKETIFLLKIKL